MKVYGITGGVGCGKSTVLSILKKICKCHIIMADDVARELMKAGNKGFEGVVDMFGESVVASDGELDRAKLAEIIFNNPNKRMVLNSIIHPLVKKNIVAQITEYRISEEVDYVFVEAALLIEDHYEVFCDELWYIYADEQTRRERLKQSRGYSDERIDSMLKSQLSEEEFRSSCDRVINNSGNISDTTAQLVKIV